MTLKEGIYTSYEEILRNDPALPGCIPKPYKAMLDTAYYDYIDANSVVHEYSGKMFAFVKNDILYVGKGNGFYKVIIKGAVSVFYKVNSYYMYQANYTFTEDKIFIVDSKTGSVSKLTSDNLEKVLRNDPKLYDEYAALSSGKQRKYMLAYVNKYNERNTVYLINE